MSEGIEGLFFLRDLVFVNEPWKQILLTQYVRASIFLSYQIEFALMNQLYIEIVYQFLHQFSLFSLNS